MPTKTITVTGMACGGCEDSVEEAVGALEGVDRVTADNESDSVEIEFDGDVGNEEITAAIEEAGYDLE